MSHQLPSSGIANIPVHYLIAMPRTGSTLLSIMLNKHPQILSTIEEPFYFNLYPKYKKIKDWNTEVINRFCADFFLFSNHKLEMQSVHFDTLKGLLTTNSEGLNFEKAIRLAYMAFSPDKDKSAISCILDKELQYYQFIRKVAQRYPQTKFIVLFREPVDNIYRWQFMRKKRKRKHKLSHLTKLWSYRKRNILQQLSQLPTSQVLLITYENLINDTEKTISTICSFLNIPYSPEILKNTSSSDYYATSDFKEITHFHEMSFKKPDKNKIGEGYRKFSDKEIQYILQKTESLSEDTSKKGGYPFFSEELIVKTWYMLPFSFQRGIKIIKARVTSQKTAES